MTKMNSAQRVFKVLNGAVPDRVPLMEVVIDKKVRDSILPGSSYEDFIDEMDIDVVCCEIWSQDNKELKWVDERKKIYRDKWGALQRLTEEFLPVPVKPPRIRNLDDFKSYTPPDPAAPGLLDDFKKTVERFKDKKAICFVGESELAVAEYLRAGLEDLMIDFATNPVLVKKLMKISVEYYIDLYRRVIDLGADMILLGDDYAGKNGTFMSPAHFDLYILPELTRVVKEIKKKGAYVIKHTDGNIWKIIDRLIGSGIDALGPLEPGAGMDYKKIKDLYGNKICLVGNVDVDLLCRGTEEEIKSTVKKLIEEVSIRGGHILSSGNTITSAVNPKNYLAMIETAKNYKLSYH
jgi:uroporphyrinogen decarboxylase